MTQPSQSDRRRLVEALGLGPLWVRRTSGAVVDAVIVEDDVRTLDWETLQRMVSYGRACGLRSADLPRTGAMRPEWLVIGGLADEEDAFAGPSGRLLDAMLAAIGLGRDRTVFVAGLVKCASHAAGGAICRALVERQIELLAPRMILVVGDVAVTALFPDAANFDGFRGKEHVMTIAGRDIPVVATFHPSRLLEDGAAKAQAWTDLCLARALQETRSAVVSA